MTSQIPNFVLVFCVLKMTISLHWVRLLIQLIGHSFTWLYDCLDDLAGFFARAEILVDATYWALEATFIIKTSECIINRQSENLVWA